MRQPVRICFYADGRAKPVTGHIFLREHEDGVCRLSVWDTKLNIHESIPGDASLLTVYFISYLQRFITEWEVAQNAAVEDYARWIGRFSPKHGKVGRPGFRTLPVTVDWENFKRGVTATREGLQVDVTAALKGLSEWGNKSDVRMPRIVFPHPWQVTSLTSSAGLENS